MRKIEITPAQRAFMLANWYTMPRTELKAELGECWRTIYRFADELGLKKDYTPRNKIRLSDEELDYLVKHFPGTENDELMVKLNISHSTLHRLARKYGLKKSKQYLRKVQVESHAFQSYYFKKIGYKPPRPTGPNAGSFKPGVTSLQRLGLVGERMRIQKAAATAKKNRERDRKRIAQGLPPLHHYKIVDYDSRKVGHLTHYLKTRGYMIDKPARVAYYNEQTQRSPRLEARRDSFYKFEQTR